MSNELQRANTGIMGFLSRFMMSDTDRTNADNRGVTEYAPCNVDAFFDPSKGAYNALISGGDQNHRVRAMVSQVICAAHSGFPVVVVHEGNHELENQLRRAFSGSEKYSEISLNHPCFEPLYNLSKLEIAKQIIETAPKDYDIKVNARYYIEGIGEFLIKKGKNLSFNMFSTCPHSIIFDKVDDLHTQGKLNDSEANDIKSKLMMGQSENLKIDTFLANLKMEILPIIYEKKKKYKPTNIISAVQSNSVLCVDVVSSTNKLLMNTVFYQLKLALTRGMQYAIIIDSIPIGTNETYIEYLKSSTDKICKMIASDDLYAMVGSDEKLFSTIVGNSQILIVMGHTAGYSAVKWAEVFGQYDKYEETHTTARGGSKSSLFSIFYSPNYQNSVSISKNREYIVKPEAISHMGYGEAYILTAARGELAHLVLT